MTDSTGFPATFSGVLDLLRRLRGPEGCPWDREQTPKSLLPYLLEEAHEAAHAIEVGDDAGAIDELGDLLLHLAFQIAIAEEEERFDLETVAGSIIAKMIRRHPHVFGDADYEGDGHQAMWERLKREEKSGEDEGAPSVIGQIPDTLPALVRAYRIQEKVASVGFDWQEPDGAREKAEEELRETIEATEKAIPEALDEEFGDLLFAIVNWGRLLGLHPHTSLQRANRKFAERFGRLEDEAHRRGLSLEDEPLEVLDALWNDVKEAEKKDPP